MNTDEIKVEALRIKERSREFREQAKKITDNFKKSVMDIIHTEEIKKTDNLRKKIQNM